MRIIMFTSADNTSGGVRQAAYQTEGLRDLGHETFFCLPEKSAMWQTGMQQTGWVPLKGSASSWKKQIEQLFPSDPHSPLIVHAFHNLGVKLTSWWGLFWKRGRNLACVAHRGVIYRPGNPLPYLSPAMRMFLPNSEACSQKLRFYCPAFRRTVVRNGIPDARIIPSIPKDTVRCSLDIPQDAFIFGYVGNNNPVKGFSDLLQAFALSGLSKSVLVAVGADAISWKKQCESLGIADRVLLLGRREQVCNYLQICDAFVFPSFGMDSAPNTLMEATRMGLPVIACNVGGVPEIVSGNGFIVPPKSIVDLAEAMRQMHADADLRRRQSAQSLLIGSTFSVESRCRELERIYRSVLPLK
ncbi:MAG: glycosyltransferase family 4 protein [Desulfovibrionaceae bacterium]|nr:glycosyltransferase family 4 protein [Desulfovibrionaceae bacterium]